MVAGFAALNPPYPVALLADKLAVASRAGDLPSPDLSLEGEGTNGGLLCAALAH